MERGATTHDRCKPVRPTSLDMMTVGAGMASSSKSEERRRDEARDQKTQDMESENELELFGPSSNDDEPVPDEGQDARRVSRPNQPTTEEILQHEITHIPYRSWCQHCVRGKCNNPPHRRVKEGRKEEKGVPTVSMD